jgi:GNAT superfamily N-acetyltransferase
MSSPTESAQSAQVSIRGMRESDLPDVARIFRVAFGTFFSLPEPHTLWPDRDHVGTRWRADPSGALIAEANGALVGSNFATNWGNFAFFGPLSIEPALWNQGIAQKLVAPTVDMFDRWGVREAGLFTFAQSTKHINLYQKFGFWARFLTALMSKAVEDPTVSKFSGQASDLGAFITFSTLTDSQQQETIKACRKLTASIFDGLDVTLEIASVQKQSLGDTILMWAGDSLAAFAVCHCGPGTEAGNDCCFVKFAAVRPGANADQTFDRLLDGCENFAKAHGTHRLEAGVNLARSAAYRTMLRHGFRSQAQGVAMHRPDSPGYNRPDVYVIDDWR